MSKKYTYDIYKDGHLYMEGIQNEKEARRLYKMVWDVWKMPRVLKLLVNETTTRELINNCKED